MERESIEYRGKMYHRYPESKRPHLRNYYWHHGKWKEPPVALHKQVYIDIYGPIPEGMQIHHKDGDFLNNSPENLLDFVSILSEELVRAGVLPKDYDFESHKKLVPMQKGDVPITYADTSDLERDFGYKPSTSLRDGLRRFAEWYYSYYIK